MEFGYSRNTVSSPATIVESAFDIRAGSIPNQQVPASYPIVSTPASVKEHIPPPKVVQTTVTRPVKPTSAVISKSGLTESHVARIFEGTPLAGQALEKPILEIEELYGINAYFTIAIMKLESGHGKSRLAKDKNNLFGLNAIDGHQDKLALRFPTKADCVYEFGKIISRHYLKKGFTTVEKVASKYCPANPKWSNLVNSIMRGDYRKAADMIQ